MSNNDQNEDELIDQKVDYLEVPTPALEEVTSRSIIEDIPATRITTTAEKKPTFPRKNVFKRLEEVRSALSKLRKNTKQTGSALVLAGSSVLTGGNIADRALGMDAEILSNFSAPNIVQVARTGSNIEKVVMHPITQNVDDGAAILKNTTPPNKHSNKKDGLEITDMIVDKSHGPIESDNTPSITTKLK